MSQNKLSNFKEKKNKRYKCKFNRCKLLQMRVLRRVPLNILGVAMSAHNLFDQAFGYYDNNESTVMFITSI